MVQIQGLSTPKLKLPQGNLPVDESSVAAMTPPPLNDPGNVSVMGKVGSDSTKNSDDPKTGLSASTQALVQNLPSDVQKQLEGKSEKEVQEFLAGYFSKSPDNSGGATNPQSSGMPKITSGAGAPSSSAQKSSGGGGGMPDLGGIVGGLADIFKKLTSGKSTEGNQGNNPKIQKGEALVKQSETETKAVNGQIKESQSKITGLNEKSNGLKGEITTAQGDQSKLQSELSSVNTKDKDAGSKKEAIQSKIDAADQKIKAKQQEQEKVEEQKTQEEAKLNELTPKLDAATKKGVDGNKLIEEGKKEDQQKAKEQTKQTPDQKAA